MCGDIKCYSSSSNIGVCHRWRKSAKNDVLTLFITAYIRSVFRLFINDYFLINFFAGLHLKVNNDPKRKHNRHLVLFISKTMEQLFHGSLLELVM